MERHAKIGFATAVNSNNQCANLIVRLRKSGQGRPIEAFLTQGLCLSPGR